MELRERIEMLLHFKNMSPSQFAEEVGVQRSGISHILSGRNRPSLDLVTKICKTFPEVSYDWLIDGTGSLEKTNKYEKSTLKTPPQSEDKNITDGVPSSNDLPNTRTPYSLSKDTIVNKGVGIKKPIVTNVKSGLERKLKKVILLYTDGTMESYEPPSPPANE